MFFSLIKKNIAPLQIKGNKNYPPKDWRGLEKGREKKRGGMSFCYDVTSFSTLNFVCSFTNIYL